MPDTLFKVALGAKYDRINFNEGVDLLDPSTWQFSDVNLSHLGHIIESETEIYDAYLKSIGFSREQLLLAVLELEKDKDLGEIRNAPGSGFID
jgi:hypothetical protein